MIKSLEGLYHSLSKLSRTLQSGQETAEGQCA